MAINSPVIALDLDFTLARFQNGYEGIFDVAESFGIARTFAEYQIEIQINCETGFNFERYSNALFPNDTAQSFALCKAFDEHFERNFCWYPEVRDILDKWQKQ
jgi:hypothetical protein